MFARTMSSESSVARSSKALKGVITRKENKTRESLEQNATFVPFELSFAKSSVRRLPVHWVHQPPTIFQEIDKKFLSVLVEKTNPKIRNNGHLGKINPPHRRSKQPQHQEKQRAGSKSPRSNSNKRVTRPRSSSKNTKSKGPAP